MCTCEQDPIVQNLPRAERIARFNDTLRKTWTGGRIMATRGVRMLAGYSVQTLLETIASYDGFDAENDPHGERDFGDVTYCEAELFWKIDYYDAELVYGSDDPADPNVTTRVLTIMLAEEY